MIFMSFSLSINHQYLLSFLIPNGWCCFLFHRKNRRIQRERSHLPTKVTFHLLFRYLYLTSSLCHSKWALYPLRQGRTLSLCLWPPSWLLSQWHFSRNCPPLSFVSSVFPQHWACPFSMKTCTNFAVPSSCVPFWLLYHFSVAMLTP